MPRLKTYLSPEEQWKRTVALYKKHHDYKYFYGHVGVIRSNHRLFLKGDVVLVVFSNGQAERWMMCGVSSKGRSVSGMFLEFQKWTRGQKETRQHGPMELIELPGHPKVVDLDSPAIWQLVAALRTR